MSSGDACLSAPAQTPAPERSRVTGKSPNDATTSLIEARRVAATYDCEVVTRHFIDDVEKARSERDRLVEENVRLRRRLAARPFFWWLRRA